MRKKYTTKFFVWYFLFPSKLKVGFEIVTFSFCKKKKHFNDLNEKLCFGPKENNDL